MINYYLCYSRKDVYFKWSNEFWSDEDIIKLTGVNSYVNI